MTDIVIFGTSKLAEQVYKVLIALKKYNIIGFTDNNAEKWGKKLFQLPIIPVQDLKRSEDIFIVIGSSYYIEISEQLERMNIVNYCTNIHKIIKDLNEQERKALKYSLKDEILPNINLDYIVDTDVFISSEVQEDNKILVISDGYPSKQMPSTCGFVHRRIVWYKKYGLNVEVYSCSHKSESLKVYEYENIKVYRGDEIGLGELLNIKKYKKILIHFVNKDMIYAIDNSPLKECPIIIWCHGMDALRQNSYFNNYTKQEIEANKKAWENLDNIKIKLLKSVFRRSNVNVVFVSKWMMNRTYKSIGCMPINYSIIPNYIDGETFRYKKKEADDRKKIISIKSHSSRKYANDITAKAILELSTKEIFKDLTFCLCGDGELWDENYSELQKFNFENVIFKRKIFTQEEMNEEFSAYGVCLSPTRLDAQGVTAGEAMSAGLAVISCNTGAISEFLDEECASLYEFDNYMQMAEEIEFLYYHPEEYLKKSRNAAVRVKEQCGYKETIAKEIDLIQS